MSVGRRRAVRILALVSILLSVPVSAAEPARRSLPSTMSSPRDVARGAPSGIEWAGSNGGEGGPSVDRFRLVIDVQAEPAVSLRPFASLFRWVQLRAGGLAAFRPGTKFRVTAVAYSSTVSQTDLTPCITAIGTRVRRGIVATNFLPIGTRLRIGDEMFVVEDRMNERYNGKYIIDIWHPTTKEAEAFGARLVEVEILASGAGSVPRATAAPTATPPPAVTALPSGTPTEEPAAPVPTTQPGLAERTRVRASAILRALSLLLGARVSVPQETDCLTQ